MHVLKALSFATLLSATPSVLNAATTLTLPSNEWVSVSIPGDLGPAGRSIRSLFGDDLPMDEAGDSWRVFRYLPEKTGGKYQKLGADSHLYNGEGYWFVQGTGAAITLDLPADVQQPAPQSMAGCSTVAGCTQILLDADSGVGLWNLIGMPLDHSLPLAETRAVADTGACATGCTLDEATDASVLFNRAYEYRNGNTATLTPGDNLTPWRAVWMVTMPGADTPRLFLPAKADQDLPDLADYELVFSDEFDGPALDATKWNTGLLWGPYIRINNEQQFYVDTLGMHTDATYNPFRFSPEGTLLLTADTVDSAGAPPPMPAPDDPIWSQHLEYRAPQGNEPPYNPANHPYLSGILTSYEAFKFTHGYAEMRAKVPGGQGLWPAFWLLNSHYVKDAPEIDIMEFLGHTPNTAHHSYHYFDTKNNWARTSMPTANTVGPDFTDGFHDYAVKWGPSDIVWYVDGIETHRTTNADYRIANQAMYLIANLAVGGNWPGPADATTPFPAVFEIDYIRAYKRRQPSPVDLSDFELVFEDDFNGTSLDASKWNTHFPWGPFLTINSEEQYYFDMLGIDSDSAYSPFTVANGELTITAASSGSQTPSNDPPPAYPINDPYWADKPSWYYNARYSPPAYTSGLITTADAFTFTHGYAEVRAKVPQGNGLWPAFWLLNKYYVGRQPEIDVMEILGEAPGVVHHSYHRLNPQGITQSTTSHSTGGSPAEGFADGFHTFGVHWTHDRIDWYVDGVLENSYSGDDVSYQIMYVLLNLAVGGGFNQNPVDPASLPAEYVVDYVRVYQQVL